MDSVAWLPWLPWLPWLLCALILFVGCCIQAALGFGVAILGAPVIILLEPSWVPYVLTTTALLLSGANAWYQRKDIHLQAIVPAMLARIPGTVIGAWLLISISALWLHIFVAVSVLIAVIVSISAVRFEATPARLSWAGLLSGFMGTTTSIGGPPIALVMQFGDPASVRANLSFYFAFSCVVSLMSYAVAGLLNSPILLLCLSFTPSAILGFAVGKRLQAWVDRDRFRPLMLALCVVASAISLIGVAVTLLSGSST